MASGRDDPVIEIGQRVFDLYIELFDRRRPPDLEDIARIVYILRLMQRRGMFDDAKLSAANRGVVGQLAEMLGITPGLLWLTVVLLGVLVGKPFFDFLGQVLPFSG
jgi:hypothetical protein